MIIKDFETFVVGNPPPRFGGRYFIFVKLVTDSGVVGYGEAYCATFGAKTVEAMLRDTAERFAVGRDPFHIEALWRSIYGAGYNLRPDVSLMAVLSALEMACWDIIGKECGKPVYELLGGQVHEKLRTYTYIYPDQGDVYPDEEDAEHVYFNPERAAERALRYVEQGFTALRFDPAGAYTVFDGGKPTGSELERSAAFLLPLREAAGADDRVADALGRESRRRVQLTHLIFATDLSVHDPARRHVEEQVDGARRLAHAAARDQHHSRHLVRNAELCTLDHADLVDRLGIRGALRVLLARRRGRIDHGTHVRRDQGLERRGARQHHRQQGRAEGDLQARAGRRLLDRALRRQGLLPRGRLRDEEHRHDAARHVEADARLQRARADQRHAAGEGGR